MTNLYEMLDASQVIHKEKPLDTRLIIEFQKKLQKAGYPALPPAFLSFLKVYDGVLMTDSAVLGIEPSKSELNLFEFNILHNRPGKRLILGYDEFCYLTYDAIENMYFLTDRDFGDDLDEFEGVETALSSIIHDD